MNPFDLHFQYKGRLFDLVLKQEFHTSNSSVPSSLSSLNTCYSELAMPSLVHDTIRLETPKAGPCDIEIIYYKGTNTTNNTITPSEKQPSVILLPYWGGTARTYGNLQTYLAKHHPELTTTAISYPGTGKSSRDVPPFDVEGIAKRTPINNLALMVKSVLRKLETRGPRIDYKAGIILVGHSMGAKIATAVLASEMNLSVKAVILLAPAPPGPMAVDPIERKARAQAYDNVDIARYAIKEKLTLVHTSESMLLELVEDAVSMSSDAKAHWMEYGADEDITPRLAAASADTKKTKIRLLAGMLDEVETFGQMKTVTMTAFTGNGFGDVQILEVKDCGHLMPVEETGVIEVTRVLVEMLK